MTCDLCGGPTAAPGERCRLCTLALEVADELPLRSWQLLREIARGVYVGEGRDGLKRLVKRGLVRTDGARAQLLGPGRAVLSVWRLRESKIS